MQTDDDYAPQSPYSTGLSGRCPRCGDGHLFKGFLDIAPRCDVCGLEFAFADAGDGPAIFVMLLAGFLVVGTALIDALKSSLDKDNRATAGSIEAVTSLVRELAAGVRAARKG